jgi:dCMP deaminase
MTITADDRRFLQQCTAVKKDSYDPERAVGAIVVGPDGRVLAAGANKPPVEMGLTRQASLRAIRDDPEWKYFMLEHAERNAIRDARNAGHALEGGTLYGTLFPCADCARAIVGAGVKRIVVPDPDDDRIRNEKWREHFRYAAKILELARVRVDFAAAADIAEAPENAGTAGSSPA